MPRIARPTGKRERPSVPAQLLDALEDLIGGLQVGQPAVVAGGAGEIGRGRSGGIAIYCADLLLEAPNAQAAADSAGSIQREYVESDLLPESIENAADLAGSIQCEYVDSNLLTESIENP